MYDIMNNVMDCMTDWYTSLHSGSLWESGLGKVPRRRGMRGGGELRQPQRKILGRENTVVNASAVNSIQGI